MNEWVKIEEDFVSYSYFVKVGEKYVTYYRSKNGEIGLSKKREDAKTYYTQEDDSIPELNGLWNEYPNARIFGVRRTVIHDMIECDYSTE